MRSRKNEKRLSLLIGFSGWVIFVVANSPFSFYQPEYVYVLLLSAPLWLIPMAWQIVNAHAFLWRYSVAAALIFSASFLMEKNLLSAVMTLPWFFLTLIAAFYQLNTWRKQERQTVADYSLLAAFLYLPVGVAWAFADRLAIQPIGFSPIITLLTAAHFHYAGFLLPILSALLLADKDQLGFGDRLVGWGIIFGIPLTALGITTTHFELPVIIEIISVTLMAGSGIFLGMAYIRKGWLFRQKLIGMLWLGCGCMLLGGMVLAMGYGWRSVVAIPQLNIPWMYAVHGSLNAIGFAFPGILAWWLRSHSSVNA